MTKLRGTLPKEETERNGLDAEVNEQAVSRPAEVRYLVAAVSTAFTKRVYHEGDGERPGRWTEEATLGIEAIEMLSGPEAQQAERLLESRFARRTGNPISGDVKVMQVDGSTGELFD